MKVLIPSPLRSYTSGKDEIEASGTILKDLLLDMDQQFPGMRFRIIDEQDQIRTHIKIFIEQEQEMSLQRELKSDQVVQIICSLSGG